MKRLIIAALAVLGCVFGIWQAISIGYARTLAHAAAQTNDIATAEKAIRWAPRDAEPHSVRGLVLQRTGSYADACVALERAIQLRPRDYFLWMLLGVSRDLNEDRAGALGALSQAVSLSPSYARSRWLFGNLLLRANRTDEAFQELRLAARSDETIWPNVIDLAWGVYRHDAARTVAAIQPQTDNARMALAIFFARNREPGAALSQFRAVGKPSTENCNKLVTELMNGRSFPEAYEVWRTGRELPESTGALLNPGFEEDVVVGETGFGWQIGSVANVILSGDQAQIQSGQKSLHLDFRGESNPAGDIISQVVIVSPQTNYRLTFQARTKDFVSAGQPVVQIIDAADEKMSVLKASAGISSADAWREFSVEFLTGLRTNSVRIMLVRSGCDVNPCAAFGTLWLDSFDLKAMPSIPAPSATAQTAGK